MTHRLPPQPLSPLLLGEAFAIQYMRGGCYVAVTLSALYFSGKPLQHLMKWSDFEHYLNFQPPTFRESHATLIAGYAEQSLFYFQPPTSRGSLCSLTVLVHASLILLLSAPYLSGKSLQPWAPPTPPTKWCSFSPLLLGEAVAALADGHRRVTQQLLSAPYFLGTLATVTSSARDYRGRTLSVPYFSGKQSQPSRCRFIRSRWISFSPPLFGEGSATFRNTLNGGAYGIFQSPTSRGAFASVIEVAGAPVGSGFQPPTFRGGHSNTADTLYAITMTAFQLPTVRGSLRNCATWCRPLYLSLLTAPYLSETTWYFPLPNTQALPT
jgi:hypothetical protein